MGGARGAVKWGGRGGRRALSWWGTRPSSGGPIEFGRGRRLDAWLRRQSEATILALGCVLVGAFGYADYVAAPDLAPLVYLAPLSLVAWYAGWWPAVGIAVASTLAWLLGASDPRPDWDVAVRFGAFLVVGYVVAARRRSLDREEQLARTDPLTGLANLRAFYELADAEIARARRYTHPFTAIYVDLNGFKAINDRLGHTAGDGVLRAVARGIRDSVRATDLVARVGGDEFVILLPETSAAPARLVSQKLQDVLARTPLPDDAALSPSMGVATYFTPPPTVDALVQTADALMHHAKARGEGGVEHRTFN